MPGNGSVEQHLNNKNKGFTSGAGVTTLSAAQATFDAREMAELERVAAATGQELVWTAGALKIRPKDSTL